jgi:VWFA-related protein
MRLHVKFRGFPEWLHSNRVAFVSSACVFLFCMSFAQQSSFAQSPDAHPAVSTAEQAPSVDVPTLKSSSNLVLVPTVVRDRQGKPLAGLTKDAFRLEENGKPQTISLFEEVHASDGDSPPYPSPELGYSNLPFANASQQSLVIIVLDLLSTKPIQREDGKQLMIKFLSSRLPRGQMVAELSITSKGLQSIHPFSTDTKSLIEALRKTPTGAETIMPRPNVVDTTIGAITELAQSYAGVEGRKTMIFAAGNIAELVGENQIVESSAISDSLRRMWRSLIGANISVYPIGLMDWAARPDQLTARQQFSVNTFADATGGGRCVESNDLMGCLAEAVQDSRSYYMLGFSVPPEDRKPGWRNLKVKVSVEHASVSARNGFYYGTPPVEQAKRPSELKALASALPQSAIPMFVKVLGPQPGATPNSASSHAADGNAAGKNSIAFRITIPLNGLLIDPSSRSALDLEVGAIALTQDKKGPKEAAEFLQPVKGDPNPENLQTWAKEGIRLPVTLDLPPGSYDLRFFARDNNSGHIGTVVFPLEVK